MQTSTEQSMCPNIVGKVGKKIVFQLALINNGNSNMLNLY